MLNYIRNRNRFMLVWLTTLFLLVFLLLRFDIVRGLNDIALEENLEKGAYSHAWRSLNNIHADHVITSMPITQ